MAEFRHAVIAALVCFALLLGAGLANSGVNAFDWRWLGTAAIISVIASLADILLRRRRGSSQK